MSPEAVRGRQEILRFINDGLGWRLQTYAGDGAYSWCGAFVAWCWLAAGMTPEKAKKFSGVDVPGHPFASTYRLTRAAQKDPDFLIPTLKALPGDAVVIKHAVHPKRYGDHITMLMAWDKLQHSVICVHGNGNGRFPDGSWGEGVVVSSFPVSAIVAVYRPNSKWGV